MKGLSWFGWAAIAVLAAFCVGTIALHRGETISAMWLVMAAVSAPASPAGRRPVAKAAAAISVTAARTGVEAGGRAIHIEIGRRRGGLKPHRNRRAGT